MLAASGIAYAKNDDGQVTVAESMLSAVRQMAADRGVITPPRDGLETFQDDNYGATEFVQRVNYQRALQAEVERTIIKLDGVLDARVHMRQPQRSTFYRRDEPTRASILVKLDEFANLDRLAPSIAQLAAGAVDGLEASDVNIVADSGAFTSGVGTVAAGGSRQQKVLEDHYRQAIASVLKPFYAADQLGITVTVEIDRRKRIYRRDNVPIAASRVATRTSVTPGSEAEGSSGDARIDEYTFGVESESIETPAGEISRIGIGVMIADRLTVEEIANIEQLITSTIGVSDARGDSVKVISYAPESATVGNLEPPPLAKPSAQPAEEKPSLTPHGGRGVSTTSTSLSGAFRGLGQKEFVLMGAGLSGGLLLFGAVSVSRQISRRRITRDVLAWIEDDRQ